MRDADIIKELQILNNNNNNRALNDLTDATILTPADSEVLTYDGDAGQWRNKPVPVPEEVGHKYYDRGDPASEDFSVADFSKDGVWHTLDLSSIVPEGTVAVYLRVRMVSNLANNHISLRKKGNFYDINRAVVALQVANLMYYQDKWVACDSNRKIEYRIPAGYWPTIDVSVRAWLK